eukprot:472565_1
MSKSLLNLSNKVAIITGAANGIGRATAKLFATQNAKVIATDFDLNGLETLKQEINGIDIYKIDVTNNDQVKDYIDDVYNKYNKINILCNIAGVMPGAGNIDEISKPLHKRDLSLFKRTIDINLYGSIYHCYNVIDPMLKTIENSSDMLTTSIINTSSEQSERATAGLSDYNISKYAIDGLTHSLCSEYSASGIRCNAIKPGATVTQMMTNIVAKLGESGEQSVDEILNGFKQTIAMERFAQPLEIANLFLYLASDESSFCSGSLMLVDGGRSSQYSHFTSFVENMKKL